MLRQVFLAQFEPIGTGFGPWKIPKCLETTGSGPVGTTGGAPRGTAGSGTWTVRGGDPAAVSPGWGTARGGAAAGAPILLASPGGTPRASPCDTPCCWAPRPGAGTGTGTGTGTVC